MATTQQPAESQNKAPHLRYFYILSSVYIASIMTSLTVSARLMPLHIPWTHLTLLLTGGTWTIPLSFFVQDIVTEVYGYANGRKLIYLSMIIVIFYIAYTKLNTYFPTPVDHTIDAAYNTVFNALPRHLMALLVALFIGHITNNYIISRLKRLCAGRYVLLRFITATAVGEAALQLVGTSVAWLGRLHFITEILPFVAFSYAYKLAFETVLSPLGVWIADTLKAAEGVDIYDTHVNYNPFTLRPKRISRRK